MDSKKMLTLLPKPPLPRIWKLAAGFDKRKNKNKNNKKKTSSVELCDNIDLEVKAAHCALLTNGAHRVLSLWGPKPTNLREES